MKKSKLPSVAQLMKKSAGDLPKRIKKDLAAFKKTQREYEKVKAKGEKMKADLEKRVRKLGEMLEKIPHTDILKKIGISVETAGHFIANAMYAVVDMVTPSKPKPAPSKRNKKG